jgi:hypothetical protein
MVNCQKKLRCGPAPSIGRFLEETVTNDADVIFASKCDTCCEGVDPKVELNADQKDVFNECLYVR